MDLMKIDLMVYIDRVLETLTSTIGPNDVAPALSVLLCGSPALGPSTDEEAAKNHAGRTGISESPANSFFRQSCNGTG